MDSADLLALMVKFRTAYGRGDRDALLAVTTDDFEWHQHSADTTEQLPHGRVLQGIDELLAELVWRSEHWQEVRYQDLEERAAGDVLLQTFTISGVENGKSFKAKVVDLYPVRDGCIYRKDTYWKYLK